MPDALTPLGTGKGVACRALPWLVGCGLAAFLAGCATQPPTRVAKNGRFYDEKLGVFASPKLVADGDPVPRGGGSYLTGRAYTIAGRRYVPSQDATGYSVVGTASWYGDAFHGRRTANGEIFDKGSITAAHPTLPLPSYVRVTNLKNGRSMVVRVNDRGPYHGGRVMDVSQRVAESLDFKGEGTAHIKLDYIGRAPLQGSDEGTLIATLRTDGSPAQLNGEPGAGPSMVADNTPPSRPTNETPQPLAAIFGSDANRGDDETPASNPTSRLAVVPLPPQRPFNLGEDQSPLLRRRASGRDKVAELADAPQPFAPPRAPVLAGAPKSGKGVAGGLPRPLRQVSLQTD